MARKPSAWQRLKSAVAYYRHGWPAERKQAPFIWPSWRSGQPQWSIVDASAYIAEGFEQNAIIYSAIMYKARAACVAPLRAYAGNRDDAVLLPDNAPLAALCRQPNEFMAWSEFQMLNTVFLNLIGNSFVYVDNKARKDGAPTSLYALRPDRVAIVPDKKNGLKGYLYTPEGQSWENAFPILPQDMIHVRLPNPGDNLEGLGWGLSPISPMARSADVDNAATNFLKLFFEHGAMIPGVLSFDVPMTDDEVARARERWMEIYGGYENWSDTAVLDQGGKYQRVGLAFSEMGFENIDSRDESRMVAPFGVPAVLISTRYGMERSTFSNYEEARKAFWEDTMVPEMGLFETEYQSKLPVISGSFAAFDFSNVPALRKDTPALMDSVVKAWDRGVPWIVAAKTVGLELADRFPGDDVGFLPFNSVPVTSLLGSRQRPAIPARTTQAEEAEPTEAETGTESESEEAENKARKMNPNHDARGRFAEGGGSGGAWGPGTDRDARRAAGNYDVISETDAASAAVLLTQGVEPSFKPDIGEVGEYAPGVGLERGGLYVANDEAFSKGSYGKVRLYMSTEKQSLKSPLEMEQLGRMDIDDVLGTENGAVTVGKLPKSAFKGVEVYKNGKWEKMTPSDFLESIGVDPNFPKLPSVPSFKAELESKAKGLFLGQDQIDDLVHDYNRGSLDDKRFLWEDLQ